MQKSEIETLSDDNVVRHDASSAKYCPDTAEGGVCLMTYADAVQYCKERGGHVPSTRDLAMYMNPSGLLEANYVDSTLGGHAPEGYYKVAGQDEQGRVDTFYFNNANGRKLTGVLSQLAFWTSTLVLGKPNYAHVFYGPLGGGGGTPEDHQITRRHAVLFIKD